METIQSPTSLRHFAKHLFLVGRVYVERKKAREDVDNHLQKMRKSVIRMSLTYSDIDRLRQKIKNLINWERKYSKLFKAPDNETEDLKRQIRALEGKLAEEREEKHTIISENNERIAQFTESFNSVKSQMKHLHLDKLRRQQRLKALESKIREKVDVHRYFHS